MSSAKRRLLTPLPETRHELNWAHPRALEVLLEDIGSLLLVDKDNHRRLEPAVAENVEQASLLLLLAVDHLDALVDRVDGLAGHTDRDDRGAAEVLFRETFDGGRHRRGEHDLRGERSRVVRTGPRRREVEGEPLDRRDRTVCLYSAKDGSTSPS